uniref:FRIGIDA-like protein n=1 Tax=Tanacetum cinerariifolium TaxID=118510 RepID=A0A6L2J4C7_TANCI|nr:putative frigida-like protein [Tanacetum cinerariifolium]
MDSNPNPDLTELQDFVENLPPKSLKRYLSTNPHLKPHLPQSLKLAENPAKLVLEAIGKYYINRRKVYTNAQQIAARVASVMLLEAFVMISSDEGVEVGECERKLAAESAVAWRNRMVKEGGVGNVEEIDARGLLLLVSGFGVRSVGIGDLRDLIRRANVKGIAAALRRSVSFIPKVPEVIDLMVKDNLVIEAADIAYTFGLEDKCQPETILATYLQNKDNDIENGSPSQLLAAKKQLLSNYRSVKKCLESHKIDPSKLLPYININEKIQHMEHEIAEEKKREGKHSSRAPPPTGPKANRREVNSKAPKTRNEVSSTRGREEKTIQKRKAIEDETLENLKHHEEKRAYFIRENISHDQKPVNDHYGLIPYYRSTQPSNSYFEFDRNLSSNHVTTYSAPSVYSASALPENRISSGPSGFAGSYGTTGLTGPYGTSGLAGSYGTSGLTGPCGTSVYGKTVTDQLVHKVDSALIEKYLGQPYLRQSQTYDSQPSSTGLYSRPSGMSSLESYTRLPEYSPSVATRHTPDLYSFADTVEMESRGSHASRIGTMVRHAHPTCMSKDELGKANGGA